MDNKNCIYLNSDYTSLTNNQFHKEKFRLQKELLKLQEWMLKYNKKVAIIFEGRDAAGKGAAIRRISEHLMTGHFRVVELGIPTKKQHKNWLNTYKAKLPKEGEIVFFDRSWYSRALIQPTMGYCTDHQYNYFMKRVVDWEKELVKEGVIIIKFYLSINISTQATRFEIRRNHDLKYWKLSENDLESVDHWETYTKYKEKMFEKTSWDGAPWVIMNANNKLIAQLNCIRYVLRTIDYEGKKELKPKSWTIDEYDRSLMFLDVKFDNLSEEQYVLLSRIKQYL
ncbi:polyphosphate kinase 2 family protein [Brumimicrobium aurantiacum]|uniref:Polyphosphate kinase n=1 Tax=Brumimicrobium aurantiacum TaxID=1737063 RepID=A0A3E1F269_9FLAO|nr:polyphosphate kinase [Brumimicrobium aurantiacum]RFC55863.1 polyphosphate kinase [Brumimicrobium aurantiacum]